MHNAAVSSSNWEAQVEKGKKKLLGVAKRRLRAAWRFDRHSHSGYPLNVAAALDEIESAARIHTTRLGPNRWRFEHVTMLPPPAPPPKRLSDLVSDRDIQFIYEDQHSGTYLDALAKAQRDEASGPKALRQILRALEQAYAANYFGLELLPRPKVNILHRGILKIAALVGLENLSHRAMAEFLDYLCPCGRAHSWDAVRKLRKRKF